MMVLYTAALLFPGGTPAANYPVTVKHRASNREALLLTDATGTTQADNPTMTDDFGQATFWAAPGYYVTDLAGEIFEYQVDPSITDPVWPDLWVHTQSTPASVWQIAHHFGIRPHVEVMVEDEVVHEVVQHPDDEHTTITFGAPFTGVAYLRR